MSNTLDLALAAPYDPGEGQAPPGAGGILLVVNWIAWGAFVLAVVGLIVIAAKVMMARRRGGSDNAAEDFGSWVVGLIVLGSVSGIIGVILTAAG